MRQWTSERKVYQTPLKHSRLWNILSFSSNTHFTKAVSHTNLQALTHMLLLYYIQDFVFVLELYFRKGICVSKMIKCINTLTLNLGPHTNPDVTPEPVVKAAI